MVRPRHVARPDDVAVAVRRVRALPRPRLRVGGWVPRRGTGATGEGAEPDGGSTSLPDGGSAGTPGGSTGPEPPGDRSGLTAVGDLATAAWSLRRGHVVVVAVLLLVAVLGALGMVLRDRPAPLEVARPDVTAASLAPQALTPAVTSGTPSASPAPTVVVHVAGKVRSPGVIRLPHGSRVVDAVSASGGALPGVDLTTLNLARPLGDGEQILVGVTPPPGMPPSGPSPGQPGGLAREGLVDLNTATAEQLQTLPGVGPVLAQRILDFRATHGRFTSVDELREVTGVGERRFAELRARVTVS